MIKIAFVIPNVPAFNEVWYALPLFLSPNNVNMIYALALSFYTFLSEFATSWKVFYTLNELTYDLTVTKQNQSASKRLCIRV